MTQQEHESQRNLVALSLLLCADRQHPGKGHETKNPDADDRRQ